MSRNFLPAIEVNVPECKELLNRASSEFLEGRENPVVSVNKDAEFTRVWWFGVHDEAFQCRYFIDWYCDIQNKTTQFWVDNPYIGETVMPGRWRQAFTRIIEKTDSRGNVTYGVAQTLRQGWATTIDFTEARKNITRDLPSNTTGTGNEQSDAREEWVMVDFPNFAPTSVRTAILTLGVSQSDFVVEGETYAGEWHKVLAEQNRTDDGTSVITVKFAKPQYTLDAYRNYNSSGAYTARYLWNVPKDLAQTIIGDANNHITGGSATPTYRGELVDIVITKNTLDNLDARYDSVESELSTQDTIIYDNVAYAVNAPASSQGNIYRASNSFSAGGGYNSRLTYDASYDKMASFRSEATAFKIANMLIYRNSRVVLSAPDVTGSGVYRVSQRENQDGTYDGSMMYVYGNSAGTVKYESLASVLFEENETLYRNSNAYVNAPDDVQGKIYRASNQLTEEGLYNSRLTERGSVPTITHFGNLSTAFKTGAAILYRNSRNVITSPPASGSAIYRVQQNGNQDGTYDGILTFIDGANSGIYEFESLNSHLSEDNTTIYKSQSTPVTASASSRGTIFRASNQITEDGLYNSQSVYTKSNEDALYTYWQTRYGIAESYLYRNQKTWPSVTLTNATSNSITPTINADGTYDVRVTKAPYNSSGGGAGNLPDMYAVFDTVEGTTSKTIHIFRTADTARAEGFLSAAKLSSPSGKTWDSAELSIGTSNTAIYKVR